MRNRYPGICYRCSERVEAGAGHFERHNGGWRTQHAECAIAYRGSSAISKVLRPASVADANAIYTEREATRIEATSQPRPPMLDAERQSAINTVRTWRARRIAKGKKHSPSDARQYIVQMWHALQADAVAAIIAGVYAATPSPDPRPSAPVPP